MSRKQKPKHYVVILPGQGLYRKATWAEVTPLFQGVPGSWVKRVRSEAEANAYIARMVPWNDRRLAGHSLDQDFAEALASG